jgi:D-tagatose-1,6-bisphosphate aldolase subunit GatZ/KbaZ
MTPTAFVAYVHNLAVEEDFPTDRLIFGGDHLGPSAWQREPAESAMQKSAELVQACVQAGYTKIHLDTSMKLGDDASDRPLDVEVAAQRTARLARVAEATCSASTPEEKPRYVIGTEVPIPGGAKEHEEGIEVTTVEAARGSLEVTRDAFFTEGLEAAWERVVALVVQPGVEFGNDFILDYNPSAARDLARFAETIPFIYEAHSTDYQRRESLKSLVRDHFAILKVGPALTFAFREAVFALAMIENELFPAEMRSRLTETVENVMVSRPEYWQDHYRGDESSQRIARKYSRSDRIRYYWSDARVKSAFTRLLLNFERKIIPLTLVSQFMPVQSLKIRSGEINNSAEAIIHDKINSVLVDYNLACEY